MYFCPPGSKSTLLLCITGILFHSWTLSAGTPGLSLSQTSDLDPLIEAMEGRDLLLLGEATHGTEEFYKWRRLLTQRLIEEQGVRIVAVEGDWAALLRLNQWVRHGTDESLASILEGFQRWPEWMWSNRQIYQLATWMRAFNENRPDDDHAGIYGMDVYGWDENLNYVFDRIELLPHAIRNVFRALFHRMEPFLEDPGSYVQARGSVQREVRNTFQEILTLMKSEEGLAAENPFETFYLLESLRAMLGAEAHFRLMAVPGPASWNARASHFMAVVDRLTRYRAEDARAVVWAHNTHVGDARATSMRRTGQENIGSLARVSRGREAVFILGFSTYEGFVLAGRQWGEPVEEMRLVPARAGSLDAQLQELSGGRPSLFLSAEPSVVRLLGPTTLQRAVGVVFDPDFETRNYVVTNPTERYDALMFLPSTRALVLDLND